MATVTGTLRNFGWSNMSNLKPRVWFIPSGPAVRVSRLLATPPIEATISTTGNLTVTLEQTVGTRPDSWYNIRIEWLDPGGNYIGADYPEWRLYVPQQGGELSELLDVPPASGDVWVGPTPPPTTSRLWLDTNTGKLKGWN